MSVQGIFGNKFDLWQYLTLFMEIFATRGGCISPYAHQLKDVKYSKIRLF